MELTLQKPALVAAKTTPQARTIVYWIVTALFCLQMSFTAYAQLRLPQVAEAFTHLGFPGYFRVELSWAKLLGVGPGGGHRRALGALLLLLAPPAGHAGGRLTAHRRRFRSYECEEAATLAMLSPLRREASVGMLFTKATHCEKSL